MDLATVFDRAGAFDWIMQRHVHEYFDVDGRPIGEGRAQAFAQVESTMKSCPFAGSRYQHAKPMNFSALQSILPEWQNTLLLLVGLSQRFQAFYSRDVASYYDLALISGMGVFLSDYMALRRSEPLPSRDFPVWMSGLYKVCLGFQQATFLAMMNDLFKSQDSVQALPDAKGFYAYLEEQLLLIGEAEVCGGSEEMIARAYEAMKGHGVPQESFDPADLQIDWEAYDIFTFHCSNMWRKAILFGIRMQGCGLELQESPMPAEMTDAINTYLKSSFTELLCAQSGLAVEMARITLSESGRSLQEWLNVQESFLTDIGCRATVDSNDELADAVMLKLTQAFDLAGHQPVIEAAVRVQLAKYEALEAALLQAVNEHLKHILTALGYEQAGDDLTVADLTTVYGKTVRNWPEVMRQS